MLNKKKNLQYFYLICVLNKKKATKKQSLTINEYGKNK
jgi:hypothetical protein